MPINECIGCKQIIKMHSAERCWKCYITHKRKTDINMFLRFCYEQIKRKCVNPMKKDAKFKGMELCEKKAFLRKFKYNKRIARMFKEWQDSGYADAVTPSVDRKDPRIGYRLSNIHFITVRENRMKDSPRKAWIAAYKKNGEYIGKFKDRYVAAEYLDVPQLSIWNCLYGRTKSSYGYTFRWWPPEMNDKYERYKK